MHANTCLSMRSYTASTALHQAANAWGSAVHSTGNVVAMVSGSGRLVVAACVCFWYLHQQCKQARHAAGNNIFQVQGSKWLG